jgi:hypothetical protein
MEIVRCGRGGCPVGIIVKNAGILYVVQSSNRQLGDGAGRQCPTNNCGYVLRMTVRPATDTEIANHEREQAEQRERMAAYEAKVLERLRAYLAGRAGVPGATQDRWPPWAEARGQGVGSDHHKGWVSLSEKYEPHFGQRYDATRAPIWYGPLWTADYTASVAGYGQRPATGEDRPKKPRARRLPPLSARTAAYGATRSRRRTRRTSPVLTLPRRWRTGEFGVTQRSRSYTKRSCSLPTGTAMVAVPHRSPGTSPVRHRG